MSELTTQQMIDTIRRGDRLGHEFLQGVAVRLEGLNFSERMGELDAAAIMRIGTALGDRKPDAFADYADAVVELLAENKRLRAASAVLADLLSKYCTDVPLGHQPHMCAHLADAALAEYCKEIGGNADES